jgi:hypothetical protein
VWRGLCSTWLVWSYGWRLGSRSELLTQLSDSTSAEFCALKLLKQVTVSIKWLLYCVKAGYYSVGFVALWYNFPKFVGFIQLASVVCTLPETKIGRLVCSNSPPGSTVVIRNLRFFALYLLFLPSHRYRTKHNCSCQLLLNVRMQYSCFTQCQKRIKSLISFKVSVPLAELYVKYKFISEVVK